MRPSENLLTFSCSIKELILSGNAIELIQKQRISDDYYKDMQLEVLVLNNCSPVAVDVMAFTFAKSLSLSTD